MNVRDYRRQFDQAVEDCELTDDSEVILDIEDDRFGVAEVICESGRVVILAGDPADEDL